MKYEPAIGISSGAWYDDDLMKSSNMVMNADAENMLEESYNQQGKPFRKGKIEKNSLTDTLFKYIIDWLSFLEQ